MSMPRTLLIADDSVAIQRVVTQVFADHDVRVVVAWDGQDAIYRMAIDPPDVVLADTNMPCVDGYELARWVRQQPHLGSVPVLLLAGATDPVDERRLHDSGANGFLEKPFEPGYLVSRVKDLLDMKGAAPPVIQPLTAAESAPPSPPAGATTVWLASTGAPKDRPGRASGTGPAAFADHRPASPPHSGAAAATVRVPMPRRPAADVFETLLAAEQGDPAAVAAAADSFVVQVAAPAFTDEALHDLAERVVARVQAPLEARLREIVAQVVRDAVAREMTDARLQRLVGDAVSAAVGPAVEDAVRRDAAGRISQVVHDTSERLVREEIARIRERRAR